jgi:hypothetical protein
MELLQINGVVQAVQKTEQRVLMNREQAEKKNMDCLNKFRDESIY